MGACLFGGFSAFWTTLVFFLESDAYHYHSDVAGLFGLVGATGAFAASFAGKSADRKGPDYALTLGILLFLGGYLLLGFGGYHLVGLIAGVVILDVGQQMAHISNQTRVFSLPPRSPQPPQHRLHDGLLHRGLGRLLPRRPRLGPLPVARRLRRGPGAGGAGLRREPVLWKRIIIIRSFVVY